MPFWGIKLGTGLRSSLRHTVRTCLRDKGSVCPCKATMGQATNRQPPGHEYPACVHPACRREASNAVEKTLGGHCSGTQGAHDPVSPSFLCRRNIESQECEPSMCGRTRREGLEHGIWVCPSQRCALECKLHGDDWFRRDWEPWLMLLMCVCCCTKHPPPPPPH